MRALWIKILRRCIIVALALGLMGYVFGEIVLILIKMHGVNDPANESVLWRTPLAMAGLGVSLQIVIELTLFVIRGGAGKVKKTGAADSLQQKPTSVAS